MSQVHRAMQLLQDGIPLSLLIDVAGLGLPSEELYADEQRHVFGDVQERDLLGVR